MNLKCLQPVIRRWQRLVPPACGLALLLCLGVFWAGCGNRGDDDPAVVNPGGSGGSGSSGSVFATGGRPLTDSQRHAVLEAIRETVASLVPVGRQAEDRDLLAECRSMAASLLALDQVLTAQVDEVLLCVQVVLADGLALTVVNNRPPEWFGIQAPPLRQRRTHQLAALPTSSAVYVGEPLGGGLAPRVGMLLESVGYRVNPALDSLDNLRNLSDIGALFLDTHAGAFRPVVRITTSADGVLQPETDPPVYAVSSTEQAPILHLEPYEDEFRNGLLALLLVQDPNSGALGYELAITAAFIEQNWQFSDGGMVFMHTCYGGAGPYTDLAGTTVDPGVVRDASFRAGAALYAGYDNLIATRLTTPGVSYLFDRLSGAGLHEPAIPPQRPFAWPAVKQAMDAQGLASIAFQILNGSQPGQVVTANLQLSGNPAADSGALAPSIAYLEVLDDAANPAGELTLHGLFGQAPGTVMVNGTELTVNSWTERQIVAELPFDGPAAAGDVTVEVAGGVRSNTVQMTEWRGTLTLVETPTQSQFFQHDLRVEAVVEVRFRADLHQHRENLQDDPTARAPIPFHATPASSGQVSASGSSPGGSWQGGEPLQAASHEAIDGYFALSFFDPNQSANQFFVRGELDPLAGAVKLCYFMHGEFIEATDAGNFPGQIAPWDAAQLSDLLEGVVPCLQLTLEPDGTVPGGQKVALAPDDQQHMEITWSEFSPLHSPDPAAAQRR